MKHFFIILSLFLFDSGCSDEKKEQEETISVEYSVISRGSNKRIKINNKTISIENIKKAKPTIKTCSKSDWDKLVTAFKTVEVETISELKAPSEDRFFDGAAIGKLKIIYKGNVYESQNFDHGNPPEEIKALVDEILLVSENVE